MSIDTFCKVVNGARCPKCGSKKIYCAWPQDGKGPLMEQAGLFGEKK